MSGSTKYKERAQRSRGLFERPKGSGVWWVRFADQYGRIHRKRVGRKSLALKVYQERKTAVNEGRFFPQSRRRRDVSVAEMLDDYLTRGACQ